MNNPDLTAAFRAIDLTYDIADFSSYVQYKKLRIVVPFKFLREVDVSALSFVFYLQMNFTQTVTYNGNSGTTFAWQALFDATQSANEVTMTFRGRIGTAGYTTITGNSIQLGVPYAIVITLTANTGTPSNWWMNVQTIELDPDSGLPPSSGDVYDWGFTHAFVPTTGTALPCNYIRLWMKEGDPGTWDVYFHEPDAWIATPGDIYRPYHRLWNGEPRVLDYTYSTYSQKNYLLPPQEVAQGAAYDRTLILNDHIDALEADIAVLEAELVCTDTYTPGSGWIGTWWSTNKPAWFGNLPNFVQNNLDLTVDLLDSALSELINDATNGLSAIKTKIVDTFDKIETGINTRLDDASDGLQAIKSKAVDVYNRIESDVNSRLDNATNGLAAIKTKIVNVFDDLDGLLDGEKKIAQTIVEDLRDKFVTIMSNQITSTINTLFNESSAWDNT